MDVILELLLEAVCVVFRIGRSEAKRDPHGCLVWFVGVALWGTALLVICGIIAFLYR